ncbi:hypothetical protein P4S72_23475 [Vibrio sp. PP-XX7]
MLNHAAVASLQTLSGKQAVTFPAYSETETESDIIQRRILTRHIDAEAGTELDTSSGALTFGDEVAENAA